jgi:hypothetical protein
LEQLAIAAEIVFRHGKGRLGLYAVSGRDASTLFGLVYVQVDELAGGGDGRSQIAKS